MKQFFKFVFASCLGYILAGFILLIISISIIGGMIGSATSKKEVKVEPNSVLHIKLNYPISERTIKDPFSSFNIGGMEPMNGLGLNDIRTSLLKAAKDDKIKGIYLDVSVIPAGMASMEAIRKDIIKFKESGKFVIAYSEMLTERTYYIASVADKVYLNPVGYMEFNGFSANVTFIKGMLDKLEIEPQVFYVGDFKSATEPLRYTEMSDSNKTQVKAYVDGMYGYFLENIAKDRSIDADRLREIADVMEVQEPEDALKLGLVDGLKYFDEVLAELKDLSGVDDEDELPSVSLTAYSSASKEKEEGLEFKKDKIAVVYATGGIVDGEGRDDEIGSARFAKAIRDIRNDDKVKAMVLRINSGGGSALASDIILREVKLTQQKMPVIVSMGDVAASGGYYIACSADTILAEPNTITGSIGVFGVLPNMKGFFNNKLGVTFDGYQTGEHSDMGDISEPVSYEDSIIIQRGVNEVYETFTSRVAEGRGLPMDDVLRVAKGRVWTGQQALDNELVDILGGMDEALAIAADKAGLEEDEYRIAAYPKIDDPLERLLKDFGVNAEVYMLRKHLGEDEYKLWKKIEDMKKIKGVQARIPYELDIR